MVLPFLRKRSKIIEIVATRDIVFALAWSGVCAVFSRVRDQEISTLHFLTARRLRIGLGFKKPSIIATQSSCFTPRPWRSSSDNTIKLTVQKGCKGMVPLASKGFLPTLENIGSLHGKPVLNRTMSTCIFINPNIPDRAEYKQSFSELFLAPTKQIIGADGLKAVEKKTVKELNLLDPETDKESIHVQLS